LTGGGIYNLERYMLLKSGIKEFISGDNAYKIMAENGERFIKESAFKSVDGEYVKRFLGDKLIGDSQLFDIKITKPLAQLRDKYTKNLNNDYSRTAEEFFESVSETEGFFGFAHPALISLGKGEDYGESLQKYCMQNGLDWKNYLFEKFSRSVIENSNNRFVASELNYQDYTPFYDSFDSYREYVQDTLLKLKGDILKTGGLDSHSDNIFTSKINLGKEKIKSLIGE